MTNKKIDNPYFEANEDPLYIKLRTEITQNKRLPYREYLAQRTLYYIKSIATEEEIEQIKNALTDRTRVWKK